MLSPVTLVFHYTSRWENKHHYYCLTIVSSSTIQVLAVLAAAVLPRHLPGRAPLLPPVLSVHRGLQADWVVDEYEYG